jgi:hypothetical protein
MASNGCGLFGTLSKVWRVVSGGAPPFEACCDEHDLAYEQIENEADRRWADKHFLRCMEAHGHPASGKVFFVLIRCGGWLSFVLRRFRN